MLTSMKLMIIAIEKTTHNIQASKRVSYCKGNIYHIGQHAIYKISHKQQTFIHRFTKSFETPRLDLSGYVKGGTTTKQWNYVLAVRCHQEAFAELHPSKRHHHVARDGNGAGRVRVS